MDLELTFKASIEITDNCQQSGNESGSIGKDIVVNERLVCGGGKCVDRFPSDFLLPTEERQVVVLRHRGR